LGKKGNTRVHFKKGTEGLSEKVRGYGKPFGETLFFACRKRLMELTPDGRRDFSKQSERNGTGL